MTIKGAMIGYARVSTLEQNLETQVSALQEAGCAKIFEDIASGAKGERPGLRKAMDYLRGGDTLIVWKLDRLGRSLPHLVQIVEALRDRNVGFRSLTDAGMDTTSSQGRFLFGFFAVLADFERELIRERTKAALLARKARGIVGGRPRSVTPALLKQSKILMDKEGKGFSVRETAMRLRVSKSALYRALNENR